MGAFVFQTKKPLDAVLDSSPSHTKDNPMCIYIHNPFNPASNINKYSIQNSQLSSPKFNLSFYKLFEHMAGSGTEAFPELGAHCQHSDCNQLDFLPFKCDACLNVFCLEHRTSKSHQCPKPDHNSRRVVVCETCSMSIEITNGEGNEKAIQEKHDRSGDCDPSKKKKPTCSVKRCKEILTFSNTSTCKTCHTKVCLKHRFPADHACKNSNTSSDRVSRETKQKFLVAMASRHGKNCANKEAGSLSTSRNPSVKAY